MRALLVKLAQAELVEGKTRNKDRYALLELEDPAGKDAKSRLVRLLDDKGDPLAEAIVGKKRFDAFGASKGGTYVRKPGDDADLAQQRRPRCLARRARLGAAEPCSTSAARRKIAKVTVEIPGEEPLVIARDAADARKYALVGIPDGKKLKEGAGLDDIVRAVGHDRSGGRAQAGGDHAGRTTSA